MAHVLIVDDEQSICWGLSRLAQRLGHTTATAPSAELGIQAARAQRPDTILLDVRLPGMTGLEALPQLRQSVGAAPIVVMTAYGDLDTAVSAVRGGAFEYLIKPFDLQVAERVISQALAQLPAAPSEPKLSPPTPSPAGIIGSSAAMQAVFRQIALVARSHVCVNLSGESGTGKELVARAIHQYSDRALGPFVPVHIAALSPTLAESELFGHVRGAFTGAEHDRPGLFEQASGGTLFLDEVAEIPLATQVKLLRALEYGEVWPVGGNRAVPVDLRLISATHQDLQQCVARGTFRHDLLYRLISFQIRLPPLRERKEDIDDLSRHLLAQMAARLCAPPPLLAAEALEELRNRPWHGNVRELRSVLESALLVAGPSTIHPAHLPAPMPRLAASDSGDNADLAVLISRWAQSQLRADGETENLYEQLLEIIEPPLFDEVMAHCLQQCAAAARVLGLHRVTLRKKLDQRGAQERPHRPK